MRRRVAHQALQLACILQEALEHRVFLGLSQLRHHGDRLVQRHVQLRRHELGQVIHIAERHVQGAAHVTDHRAGFHRAEGDDLRDVVLAVALADILDDPIAVSVVEVDVDIWHRDALPVEEALKDQPMLQRVEGGDSQRIGDDAAGRGAPPGPDRDAV